MKKIYFLINSLEGGWAERVIHNLSAKLRDDHDVTIITLKDRHFYDRLDGVRYVSLSTIASDAAMFILIPWYAWKLRRLLRAEQYDGGVSFLEIANFVHILSRKDAVISLRVHLSVFYGATGYIKGMVYRLLIRLMYPMARRIIVNSEENKYAIAEYLWLDEDRVGVLYNPIILNGQDFDEPISEELMERLQGKKVFVTVARLARFKYHAKIIQALKHLNDQRYDDWIYLVVWDGEERENLENQVKHFGLSDRVVFLGQQKNIFPFLQVSDYFLYASRMEGFPNVLIEAMACGLPIITSDFVSGAKECILGEYPKNSWKSPKYPYFGPNGALLDLERFEDQFVQVFLDIDRITQEQRGMDRFSVESVTKNLLSIL